MDPDTQAMALQLAEVTARNLASSVTGRIRASKARKDDQETIGVLEEIVNELLADKSELTRIATSYEQELVAQRISVEDINYLSTNLLPKLKDLVTATADRDGADPAAAAAIIDMVEPILSVEAVTLLQILGFNFRMAIGEPLTQLIAGLITSKRPDPSVSPEELQKLAATQQIALMEVAQDPNACERLAWITGRPPPVPTPNPS